MSDETFSLEVDKKFIQNFFGLANMPAPENVELEDLNEVIKKVKGKLDQSILSQSNLAMPNLGNESGKTEGNEFLKDVDTKDNVQRPRSILIVDDLGIITYQMELLFKKLGFDVTVSKELYDAINKYKTRDFGYVLLDLFIPTEREGFILLDEIKKLALFCKLNTKILIMSASSKSEYKDKCISRGADRYIEKTTGWQKKIIDICTGKEIKDE
jgi:two-component system, chemotaxis family, chemotaxis protein CheY